MISRALPYAAILRARFLLLLQYRAAALAGIATQIIFGLVRVMVLEGFYGATDGAAAAAAVPLPLGQTITYIWLGQAFLSLLPWTTDGELREMVRSGNVAYELVRPVDLYSVWFFRGIALRLAPTVLRAAPLLILAWLCFGMQLPVSIAAAALWFVAMICAFILAAAITTLVTITLLWTVAGEGASRLLPSMAIIFSGLVIPLPLFPEWAQPIFDILPFRGLMDAPFRLYIGNIPTSEAAWVIGHQIVWIIIFVLLGRWLLNRGLRRLVVQGG